MAERRLTSEESEAFDRAVRDIMDVDMTIGLNPDPKNIYANLTSSDHSGILIYAKSKLSGNEFFYRFSEPGNPYLVQRTIA